MAEHMSYTAGMAKAKQLLGTIAFHAGEFEAAIQYELPSVALWRELESPFELATALNRLGGTCWKFTNISQRRQAYEECRDIYQSLGYQRGVAIAIHNLGGVAQEIGDYATRQGITLRSACAFATIWVCQRGYAYSFELLCPGQRN